MRYLYPILIFCLLAIAPTLNAQCDIQLQTTVTPVSCFGGNSGGIELTTSNGTGPYTFLWSNNSTIEDIGNLSAGTYTCTVTDALDCTATVSVTVVQPPALSVSATGGTLTCSFTTLTIVATTTGGVVPYAYTWFNGASTSSISVQSPGAYSVTVTDANGCTAQTNAIVTVNAVVPVACVAQVQLLTCATPSVTLDGSCSSNGPEFICQWSTNGGNIVSGSTTFTPTVNQPGNYSVTVTNVTNGCTAVSTYTLGQDVASPTSNAGPDRDINCDGGVVPLDGGLSSSGAQFAYSWVGPGILFGNNTLYPVVTQAGTYTLLVTNTLNGCTASDITVVTTNQTGWCSDINGRLLEDTLVNCLTDAGEPGLSGWIVQAEGALGTFYGVTDSAGAYQIFVQPGDTYAITAISPSVLWAPCAPIAPVSVPNPNETLSAADLLFQKLAGCPLLSVDLISGNLRRCFDNNFFSVAYCNNGTEPAEDAYILVTLDPLLTPLSASLPYTHLGNGVIRFEVGTIAAGDCDAFNFQALLSCDAVVGQTHCSEAHIFPDSLCIPPNVQWSGASLHVTSECEADSVHFRIENVGAGDMPGALNYIVIEDQVMLMTAPVQLGSGEFANVTVPANGSTWRLEMEQVPFHPGYSSPAVSVEGCTTGATFSTGFVTQFAADDADEFVDIHCVENTTSFDPNDKQAFPKGYGSQHYILPGVPLEYQIRFQNTGNDTAFTVRLVDTLSTWLDPASIRVGASSHPYSWDLKGSGVLTFLFEHILLPDSNINEAASHGFVKFTISPRSDAPLETVIENTAEIYFDFNEAVITNTTFHRLGENFMTVGLWGPEHPSYGISVMPNPWHNEAFIVVKGLTENTPINLQMFDLQGRAVLNMTAEGAVFQLKKGTLPAGMFIFNITQDGKSIGTGKVVIGD